MFHSLELWISIKHCFVHLKRLISLSFLFFFLNFCLAFSATCYCALPCRCGYPYGVKKNSLKKKQSLLFSIKYYICCLSPWHLKVYGPGALQELTLVTQLHIFCYIQNMLEIHWGKLIYQRRDKGMLWLMNKELDMSSREIPFISDLRK